MYQKKSPYEFFKRKGWLHSKFYQRAKKKKKKNAGIQVSSELKEFMIH